jgi:hypothetical protein
MNFYEKMPHEHNDFAEIISAIVNLKTKLYIPENLVSSEIT